MKRLAILFLTTMASFACAADFGAASWGDTAEQIRAAEGGGPLEEIEIGEYRFLTYEGEFAGWGVVVWYWLEPETGRLVAGAYSAAAPTIDTFYAWEDTFGASYGEAFVADEFVVDAAGLAERAAGDDRLAQEEDLRAGRYRLRRAWASEQTRVSLLAGGGEGDLSVEALLSSVEFGDPYFGIEEEEAPPGE